MMVHEMKNLQTLKALIKNELEELEQVKEEASEAVELFNGKKPSKLEIRGVAALLHDFYNGIEFIFEAIGSRIDGTALSGEDWHRRLLKDMALDIPDLRIPVISPETGKELDEYMRFRHVFRHQYGHHLDWERIKPLLYRLERVFLALKDDLEGFSAFLDELIDELDRE